MAIIHILGSEMVLTVFKRETRGDVMVKHLVGKLFVSIQKVMLFITYLSIRFSEVIVTMVESWIVAVKPGSLDEYIVFGVLFNPVLFGSQNRGLFQAFGIRVSLVETRQAFSLLLVDFLNRVFVLTFKELLISGHLI